MHRWEEHTLWSKSLWPVFLTLFYSIPHSFCASVTITIDDTFGDPVTGNKFIYGPPPKWQLGQDCGSTCTAKPDASQMFMNSWHDTTSDDLIPYATILFPGTAVYVQCALAGKDVKAVTNYDMTFFIDGKQQGTFNGSPTFSGFSFNHTVFSMTGLTQDTHNLTIQSGRPGGNRALILLDSVIYSREDDAVEQPAPAVPSSEGSTSSSTPDDTTGPGLATARVKPTSSALTSPTVVASQPATQTTSNQSVTMTTQLTATPKNVTPGPVQHANKPKIVAIVLSLVGVNLLFVLIFLVVRYQRKKRLLRPTTCPPSQLTLEAGGAANDTWSTFSSTPLHSPPSYRRGVSGTADAAAGSDAAYEEKGAREREYEVVNRSNISSLYSSEAPPSYRS